MFREATIPSPLAPPVNFLRVKPLHLRQIAYAFGYGGQALATSFEGRDLPFPGQAPDGIWMNHFLCFRK